MSGRTNPDSDVIRRQQERDLGHSLDYEPDDKGRRKPHPDDAADRTPNPNQVEEDGR